MIDDEIDFILKCHLFTFYVNYNDEKLISIWFYLANIP